ncbi:Tetratricopeptide-like helical [Penicillium robsamsonii]|uniref:Tetratricopeptide-like helical n=1 Tax=Penicillium robsamsonii TaxID=1792511 RepID=UPI00254804C8|nr:Tetratricopeptide-like helical [Penicillium robsamsonii]KAJ5834705.1 Tetratricopeptide-like helical [Penicillium robsamsonii]
MSNARRRAFIGDMMIIHAAVDILANAELKIWYLLPAPEYQPMDFHHWGFECCCAICADVSVTKPRVLETRVRHRAQIAIALKNSSNRLSLTRAETLIERLAETYPHPLKQVLQLGLWEPLTLIAGVYERQKRPEEAVKAANRPLAAVGFVLEGFGWEDDVEGPLVIKKWGLAMDDLVMLLIFRRSLFDVAPERAIQVERYARMAYLICVGEEASVDATYGMSLKVACGVRPESQAEGWVV